MLHADPALAGMAPGDVANLFGLVDGDHIVLLILAHHGVIGTRALADAQGAGGDVAGGTLDGGIAAGGCAVHGHILQIQPALVGAAPGGGTNRGGLIDVDHFVLLAGARHIIAGAGTLADFDGIGGDGAGVGHLEILQADPAAGNTAPLDAVHGDDLIKLHKAALLQGADLGVGRTCALADGQAGRRSDHALCHNGLGFRPVQRHIVHADPALGDAAPAVADLVDLDPGAIGQGTDLGVGAARAGADVQGAITETDGAGGDDLLLSGRSGRLGGFGALRRIVLNLLPAGVQGLAGQLGRQSIDPLTALSGGVPAQEAVAVLLALGTDMEIAGQAAVIALELDGSGGAFVNGIGMRELDVMIILRDLGGIDAVEVEICLDEAALHQAGAHGAAGIGPQGDGKQEIVAGLACDDILGEQVAGCAGSPAAAHIICKGKHGVELLLGPLQIILVDELVEGGFEALQLLLQQLLGLFFGNASFTVFFQHIIRASGAVAHGILFVIPVGLFAEAFEILDHINAFIAGLEVRSRKGRHGDHRHQQNQGHHKGQGSTFHRSFLL